MAKMTKKQQAQWTKLHEALDKANAAIYAAAAPRDDVPWRECYEMASEDVKRAWHDAKDAKDSFESDMCSLGRGYYTQLFGTFHANLA